MALIKAFTTRSGVTGNYLAITRINHWCSLTCEAEFYFSLYRDKQAARDALEPLVPIFAKLRLTGDSFLGVYKKNGDIIAAAYLIAKQGKLRCDHGAGAFKDAVDDL